MKRSIEMMKGAIWEREARSVRSPTKNGRVEPRLHALHFTTVFEARSCSSNKKRRRTKSANFQPTTFPLVRPSTQQINEVVMQRTPTTSSFFQEGSGSFAISGLSDPEDIGGRRSHANTARGMMTIATKRSSQRLKERT